MQKAFNAEVAKDAEECMNPVLRFRNFQRTGFKVAWRKIGLESGHDFTGGALTQS
jgi:hypothetical protein